jgi:hypothetical protein
MAKKSWVSITLGNTIRSQDWLLGKKYWQETLVSVLTLKMTIFWMYSRLPPYLSCPERLDVFVYAFITIIVLKGRLGQYIPPKTGLFITIAKRTPDPTQGFLVVRKSIWLCRCGDVNKRKLFFSLVQTPLLQVHEINYWIINACFTDSSSQIGRGLREAVSFTCF